MNDPTISIIIYCKNNSKNVEKAFQSVVSQDYNNKEIIIVDDASTDGSWEIINKLECVPLRHEFESNLVGAMITGINSCWSQSHIFGLLPATNEYLPGKIKKSVDYIKDIYDNVGIIYSDYETSINDIPINIHRESFSKDNLNIGNSVFITKHAIESVGMIDPDEGKDALNNLWLRITNKFAAIHVPEILTKESRSHAEIRK